MCLCEFVFTMLMQVLTRTSRGSQKPWSWSRRSYEWYKSYAGNQTLVLYKSSTSFQLLSPLSNSDNYALRDLGTPA